MTDVSNAVSTKHIPWNKGKVIGAKPPLRPKHVWSIRTKLQVGGRIRDLALFNLAIDSKLRGCDLVAVKVDDVAASGYAADRATIRQRKTGRPVKFELTEATRQAVDDYVRTANRKSGSWLFVSRRKPDGCLTNRAVRASPNGLGRQYRSGPSFIRDTFTAPNKSHVDISAHR